MAEKIDIKQLARDARHMPFWRQHLFLVMVVGALIIALFLVMISMNLYRSSGAAQLDLSRPGYEKVREQVSRSTEVRSFAPTGELTPAALDEFRQMYQRSMDNITEVDAWRPDSLSDSALSLPQVMR